MNASADTRLLILAAICSALGCSRSQLPANLKTYRLGQTDPGAIQFSKRQIESDFRAEGVTVFDVNNTGTGQLNIVTRQYWYEYPPDVSTRHQISDPMTWRTDQYSNSYANWAADIDGDGWTDLLVLPRQQQDNPTLDPIYWFRNPQGEDRNWDPFVIARSTLGERPVYEDLFGDGNKELVFTACDEIHVAQCANTNTLVWAVPGPDPTAPWVTTAISQQGSLDVGLDHHGMGVGDINGDGRLDIIVATGWFEGPEDPSQSPWVFHRENWLPQYCYSNPPQDPESCCSDMFAYDVNGDGRVDVFCARPHNRGRWRLVRLEDGSYSAQPMDPEPLSVTFSESHAARFVDLDGDGVPEFITGKRKFAHGTGGEGYAEPAVLVYYKLGLDGTWDRHDIDPDQTSGVGTQFEVADVNGDGLPDIIISNKLGLFYFEQLPQHPGDLSRR